MATDPQKFFVGLIDFFSVLLPGALLTYCLLLGDGRFVAYEIWTKPPEAAADWGVFLFISYVLGHFTFSLGHWLDLVWDAARRLTPDGEIARLADGRNRPGWLVRQAVWLVFEGDCNLAAHEARKIKDRALGDAAAAINTFQYSKAVLAIESPPSLAIVQRLEADSKFFRSFAVVLTILFLASLWHCVRGLNYHPVTAEHVLPNLELLALLLVTLLAALWRFMEQRFKATSQAYWSVIALASRAGPLPPDPVGTGTSHAGGVVYRTDSGQARYLLVMAKGRPDEWVLPKGQRKTFEKIEQTAVRVVLEETGMWARVTADLGHQSFIDGGVETIVQYYMMEMVDQQHPSDTRREVGWFDYDTACRNAVHKVTKAVLARAQAAMPPKYSITRT